MQVPSSASKAAAAASTDANVTSVLANALVPTWHPQQIVSRGRSGLAVDEQVGVNSQYLERLHMGRLVGCAKDHLYGSSRPFLGDSVHTKLCLISLISLKQQPAQSDGLPDTNAMASTSVL